MDAAPAKRLSLGRAQRIRRARDFARLRREGRRLTAGCLALNWQRLPAGTRSRLGVITSAKLGHAVVRSRTRRLLREAYRQHQRELNGPVDLILVARPSAAGRGFAEVQRDYLLALQRAGLLGTPASPAAG